MRVLSCACIVVLVHLAAVQARKEPSCESTELCEKKPHILPNLCPPVSDCECNSFCLDDLLCSGVPYGYWPCNWVCQVIHGTSGYCKPCECHKKKHPNCDCECCERKTRRCVCECPRRPVILSDTGKEI